jgi:uncharacterized protein (TIGR03435 family)
MLLAFELGSARRAPAVIFEINQHREKTLKCMARTTMKTKVLIGTLVSALMAAAIVIKLLFFPSIKDAYFAMDARSLQQVPSGVVVVRPTHFPYLRRNGILYTPSPHHNGNGWRMMGRDVPLRVVMATAYDQSPARVVLPPDAPKGNFDFLVVVTGNPRQRLQAAIRRKLGYVAQKETRETDVLALKIVNASLPDLTVSKASERQTVFFNDVKLRVTHMPLMMVASERLMPVADGLEQFLNTPVVDKTGLTNLYDYSIAWNVHIQRQLEDKTMARAAVDKILNGWGLGLQPDTASLEMLVVKEAR